MAGNENDDRLMGSDVMAISKMLMGMPKFETVILGTITKEEEYYCPNLNEMVPSWYLSNLRALYISRASATVTGIKEYFVCFEETVDEITSTYVDPTNDGS